MASSFVWALLLCAAALTTAAPKPSRIVGGESTTIDKYPWIVAVEGLGIWSGTWSQNCAANIVTSRYAMSAAHCFAGILYAPEYRRIRAGSTYRNTGGVISNVVREINHPAYGVLSSADSDICLVEMATPLVWTPVVQQGTIVAADTFVPDNLPVVHAGWGATSQGGSASPDLQHVTIYTVNRELCAQRYFDLSGSLVTENMICAGLLDVGGRDACQGDSGGPLYYGEIIIGVVSWGHGCANETYPGISTAVSPFTNWIISNAI